MNKEQQEWYDILKRFIELEYGVTNECADEIIEISSEYGLSNAQELFNFLSNEMKLISVWDKKRWTKEINPNLLDTYINIMLEE